MIGGQYDFVACLLEAQAKPTRSAEEVSGKGGAGRLAKGSGVGEKISGIVDVFRVWCEVDKWASDQPYAVAVLLAGAG